MNAPTSRQERDSRLWTADWFLEFYMTRPDEERWQLVDGLAMMVAPPMMVHQRIAGTISRLLDNFLDQHRPDLTTYYRVLVRIPGIVDFCSAPDVIVSAAEADDRVCTEDFALVAEVISPSNTAEMIERKLELYRSHPDNLYCLAIDQDSVHVALFAREDGWRRANLRSLDDVLELPAFGFRATLAEIYRGTPLGR